MRTRIACVWFMRRRFDAQCAPVRSYPISIGIRFAGNRTGPVTTRTTTTTKTESLYAKFAEKTVCCCCWEGARILSPPFIRCVHRTSPIQYAHSDIEGVLFCSLVENFSDSFVVRCNVVVFVVALIFSFFYFYLLLFVCHPCNNVVVINK